MSRRRRSILLFASAALASASVRLAGWPGMPARATASQRVAPVADVRLTPGPFDPPRLARDAGRRVCWRATVTPLGLVFWRKDGVRYLARLTPAESRQLPPGVADVICEGMLAPEAATNRDLLPAAVAKSGMHVVPLRNLRVRAADPSRAARMAANRATVRIIGQKYHWRFDYGGGRVGREMHLPAEGVVTIVVVSKDVIHTPLAQGLQLPLPACEPAAEHAVTITCPRTPGEYTLICGTPCGEWHVRMNAKLVVDDGDAFETWVASIPAAPPLTEPIGNADVRGE